MSHFHWPFNFLFKIKENIETLEAPQSRSLFLCNGFQLGPTYIGEKGRTLTFAWDKSLVLLGIPLGYIIGNMVRTKYNKNMHTSHPRKKMNPLVNPMFNQLIIYMQILFLKLVVTVCGLN
jgi:hypothetical protein